MQNTIRTRIRHTPISAINSYIQGGPVRPIYRRLLDLSELEDKAHEQYDLIFSDFIIKKSQKYDSINHRNNRKIIDTKVFHSFLGKHLNIIQIKQSICKDFYGFLIQTANRRELCIKQSGRHDVLLLQLPSKLHGTIVDFEFLPKSDSVKSSSIIILLAQNHLRPNFLIEIFVPAVPLSSLTMKSSVLYPVNVRDYEILLREDDDSYFLDMTSSKTSPLVIIHHQSKTNTEITVLSYNGIRVSVCKLLSREQRRKAFLQHGGSSYFAIVKNMDISRFQLYRIPTGLSLSSHDHQWKCELTFSKSTLIEDFDVFEFGVIAYGMEEGEPAILKIALSSENPVVENIVVALREQNRDFPLRCAIQPGINRNFSSESFSFSLSCPFLPRVAFACSLDTLPITKILRYDLGCPDESKLFSTVSVQVRSDDKVNIPLTLIYDNKSFNSNAPNKTLLSAYGSYGKCLPLHYRPFYRLLLERGWVLAFAHVRGGGELGLDWHHGGVKLNKRKSCHDFLSVSEHLIQTGLTSAANLCAEGESAGGLVIGFALNENPHLFSGVILRNAFLNISNEVKNPSSLLRNHEADEWGDADDRAIFEYIQSYCPYHNIRAQQYPAAYVRYGVDDNIVDPQSHSVLWARKLIENQRADIALKPIVLRNGNYGHHGSLSVEEQSYESALELAFLESCVVHNK